MSIFSQNRKSAPLALGRALSSAMLNGDAYLRRPDVEAEIDSILRLHESEWMTAAKKLHHETLVFLIKGIRGRDEEFFGCLVQELSKRISRLARRRVRSLDSVAAEHIVSQVEIEVLQLVLAERPSRQKEFLEIAFAKAIERRTLNIIAKHKNSPLGRRGEIRAESDDADDEDEIERPIELAADERADPEASALQLEDKARRSDWFLIACEAVKNPQWREAVVLHYVHGWPIQSKDPDKPDLVRHFNAKPCQIKYWLARSLKVMRAAVGEGRS